LSPEGRPGRHSSTTETPEPIIAVYQLTTPPGFVNDVAISRTGAWFTDSILPVLYHVPIAPDGALGPAETLPLTAPPGVIPVPTRSNGIDATPDGKTLVIVAAGRILSVDPTSGATAQILALAAGPMMFADGILLDGKTLYVVRNFQSEITVIELAPDLSSGTVVATLSDPDFDQPTTIAEHGDRLYLANARLTTLATPATAYWVTQVRKLPGD
jgi:sugar lactone lactonase YvrE